MRYFFDIKDGKRFSRDREGLQFATLNAAIEEARATALSMSHDAFADHSDAVIVRVRDKEGHIQATACIALSKSRKIIRSSRK